MGPILALIYINSGVKDMVQVGLKKVNNWLNMDWLSLNPTKTNYVTFFITNVKRADLTHIKIDGIDEEIVEKSEVKYLGIRIDRHLRGKVTSIISQRKLEN